MRALAEHVDEGDKNEHPVRQDQVQRNAPQGQGGKRSRRHGGRGTRCLLFPRGAEHLEDEEDAEQRCAGRPRPDDAPRVQPPDPLEHILAVHAGRPNKVTVGRSRIGGGDDAGGEDDGGC
ncbi:hypothetical protein GQ55_5G206200 [Panicum hallii var. hallii]|uniref:Uncharacterized protein n=1 Tax=Panicum hallii var. hallii TaxID=1504633 RepID=A0A2T7DIF4_9POAL|nr:hypothetical protein GQ55_5G206200 [Panicum hallii var. hallii]